MKCLPIVVVLVIVLIILFYNKWNDFQVSVERATEKKKSIPSQIRIPILKNMYQKIADILNDNGIPFWLYFGTLLGYVREKELICYDYDNDLSLFYKDYSKVKPLMEQLVRNNPEYKFKDYKYPFELGAFMEITHKDTNLTTDLTFWYKDKNTLHRGLPLKIFRGNRDNKVPLDKVIPLKRVMFLGRSVFIANDSEFILEQKYGKDYMTPSLICDEECNNCTPNI